ncbi:hypothetical protein WJX84_008123 [Apatococcus fuscideae]|uniref:Uncharacterized protein n=1 Tax=Apatococcus fuscideae TaxID=2026836 RepID=A0AAW1SMM4_9CHLO
MLLSASSQTTRPSSPDPLWPVWGFQNSTISRQSRPRSTRARPPLCTSSVRGQGASVLAPPIRAQRFQGVEDPVLKAALEEPVAFWGGAFAGLLGLNLSQEPLRGWLERTSLNAGVPYQMQLNKYQTEREQLETQGSLHEIHSSLHSNLLGRMQRGLCMQTDAREPAAACTSRECKAV